MNLERSEWMQGLIKAAEVAVTKTPRSSSEKHRRVNSLEAVPERGRGWFRCAAPKNVSLESVEDAVLAPAGGTDKQRYQVIESALEQPWLYVRAASTAPDKGLWLWTPSFDLRQLAEALRDSLRELPVGTLAEHFATRSLDRIPPAAAAAPGELRGTQAEAFRACCAPGLQVVWGPPGTGKTHVIVEAIDALLKQGKTILLVSSTNVAVDNAVQSLAAKADPKPGRVVRVGTPVVPAVAKDHRVALPLLVESRQKSLMDAIAGLQDRIHRLGRDDRLSRVAAAEGRISGFDFGAYDAALARASNRRVADDARQAVKAAERELETLQSARRRKIEAAVKSNWIYLRASEMTADAAVEEVAQGLAYYESLSKWARLRKKVEIGRLRSLQSDVRGRQVDARTERGIFENRYREHGADAWDLADESECRVEPHVARQHWQQHERAYHDHREQTGRAEQRVQEAKGRFTSAMAEPMPTEEDGALIADAEGRGIPVLRQALPGLRQAADAVRKEIESAQSRLEKEEEKLAKLRRSAEAAVVRDASVVACTLAAMSKRKPIRDRRFDYVIVDEAAACLLPHLVNAVGRAKTGAVLVGDYLQNGPIVEQRLLKDAELKRYFEPDCFSHFRLTDPASAKANAACAVLDEQRRFGPAVTDLINDVVYDSILVPRQSEGGEIVFIDVDGLGGDLTDIQRTGKYKGQWPIGALLARAIAEFHHREGKTVGVVTPFKDQEVATKALLDASPIGVEVEVGTAHAFQGREFDMTVFDMVEDGKGHIAISDRGSDFALGGLRIFNVALTRARQRTYLVGQGAALFRQRRGPLAAIRAGLERGTIQRVSAMEVLGIDEPADARDDGAFFDVREALKDYVRLCGLYDQKTTFEPLINRIDQARESVWVWSPWIGKSNLSIQDSLVEAAARGVHVTVVTRPDRWLTEAQQESSQDFRRRFGGRVLFQVKMHQKIAVIDRRWTFTGSLNLLSAGELVSQRTKEFMLEIEDGSHATAVLDKEKASDLLSPPPCPQCGNRMENVDIRGAGKNRNWHWLCDLTSGGCKGRVQFAHNATPHV